MTSKNFRVLLLSPLLILSGCNPFCEDDFKEREGLTQLSERQGQWDSLGYRDYVLSYTGSCFGCDGTVTVMIENGAIQNALQVNAQGQEANLPDVDTLSFTTVDSIFEYIDARDQSVDVLKVSYDSSLGYPSSVYVDHMTNRQYCDGSGSDTVDDEISYSFEIVLTQ